MSERGWSAGMRLRCQQAGWFSEVMLKLFKMVSNVTIYCISNLIGHLNFVHTMLLFLILIHYVVDYRIGTVLGLSCFKCFSAPHAVCIWAVVMLASRWELIWPFNQFIFPSHCWECKTVKTNAGVLLLVWEKHHYFWLALMELCSCYSMQVKANIF